MMNERTIFERALDFTDLTARAAFLAEACGDNVSLRARIDALLRSHEEAGIFLDEAAVTWDSTTAELSVAEQPGVQIGPYKLLQIIGEGGMGLVFMAEQTHPVRRRVALKIIKPGMDTRQVIARFNAERQALAMMDHPHIAKVLDAGTTSSGRPFFVMELVNGTPITQYADAQHLSARERLELFIPVCEAIQHAHQKGIIHRDLKPGNILVALYDGRPVPKVIDFGIAKAIDQRLTEHTLFTALGQIVGTIEYMSPEQAVRNQLDVDTRSDVYSLGVVLYELLTGDTPLDKQRVRSAAWDEILRMIRDEEPILPSARLSSSTHRASVAANRRTEPAKLTAIVRGELDWIVTKALEKDRTRRYESASQFAADVRRYLANEVVLASPPSKLYQLRKFVVRHMQVVVVALAILTTLLVGLLGIAWQAHLARRAEHHARQSLAAEQQARANENVERHKAERSQLETQSALRSAQTRLAQVYTERGLAKLEAAPHRGLPWIVEALRTETDTAAINLQRLRLELLRHDLPHLAGYWPSASIAHFSSDGSKFAVASGRELQLFELPSMRSIASMSHGQPIVHFAFSEQGDRVATITHAENSPALCRIWNTTTGRAETGEVDLADHEYKMREVPTMTFSPDGARIVATYAGLYNRFHSKIALRVYDGHTLHPLGKMFAHHSSLDFSNGYHQLSPDATRVLVPRGATADDPRANWNEQGSYPDDTDHVQQYDLLTGAPVHLPLAIDLEEYNMPIYNHDGTQIVTAAGGLVTFWSAVDGSKVREIPLSSGVERANVWFHPSGDSLVIAENHKAQWRRCDNGELIREWVHDGNFEIDPSGQHIGYRDPNGNSYLQKLEMRGNADGSAERMLPDFYRLRFAPNGSRFVLDPRNVEVGGVSEEVPECVYATDDGLPITSPWRFHGAFSQSGRFICCYETEGIWLWDLDQIASVARRFPPDRQVPIVDVAVSVDRRKLAVLASDNTISAWDTETDQAIGPTFAIEPPSHNGTQGHWTSATINPRGTRVAVLGELHLPLPGDESRTVHVVQRWNLASGQAEGDRLLFDREFNSSVALPWFLHDDATMIVPETVHRWHERQTSDLTAHDFTRWHFVNLADGQPTRPSIAFDRMNTVVGLSRDGERCLVASQSEWWFTQDLDVSEQPYAQLFSTRTWQPVADRMEPAQGLSWNAQLTPDATRVVLGNGEIWDALTAKRLSPPVMVHRDVDQLVVADDGQTFVTISNQGERWRDDATEVRVFSIDGRPLTAPMKNAGIHGGQCVRHPTAPIVVVSGQAVRFWDASRGLALSGAINAARISTDERRTPRAGSLFFSPSGKRLYIETADDVLAMDTQSFVEPTANVDPSMAWASILSGWRVDSAGGVIPLTTAEYRNAWETIRATR